jgi:hypothetical protein
MVHPLRQPKTVELDAILARAELATGRAWIKVVAPARGHRYTHRMRPDGTLSKLVMLPRKTHMFWFFEPGTESESDAFMAAKHWTKRRPRATMSVSEKCFGACAKLSVIGVFVDMAEAEEEEEAA